MTIFLKFQLSFPPSTFKLTIISSTPVQEHLYTGFMKYNYTAIATVIAALIDVRALTITSQKSLLSNFRYTRECRCKLSQTSDRIDFNSNQRQLVIFRPPSRHTYGFVEDPVQYDLPRIELTELIGESAKLQFVPLHNNFLLENPSHGAQLRKRKTRSDVQKSALQVQSIYWIRGNIPPRCVAKAASRAVLTHATFLIDESYQFTENEWNSAATSNHMKSQVFFRSNFGVIDMTKPNMSCKDRNYFVQRISNLLEHLYHKYVPIPHESVISSEPIILHHINQSEKYDTTIHYIHIGWRTAIGPAGTKGAPSQTLRRTNRGVLQKFSLKRRINYARGAEFARSNISTAMEPEIGFVMANLAMGGRKDGSNSIKVLDPCCGSGSLLLYAAALGATTLVGIDSDPSVWYGADDEFKVHHLPTPVFVEGDVFCPGATKALSTPNYFDVIICDPPYNIGAPVIVNKQDSRSKNHYQRGHKDDDKVSDIDANAQEDITMFIILLAERILVNKGRLVLFLPVRESQSLSALKRYEDILHKQCLQLVFKRKQQFSSTFSRWLVCFEKRSTEQA